MPSNKTIGDKGEDLATEYLVNKGYTLLERNWRYKRAEVDIICKLGKELIFVEVKTRSSSKYGNPEDAVNSKKQNQLISAAQAYIHETEHAGEIRFDIVSISIEGSTPEIMHIEDAFFPYQK